MDSDSENYELYNYYKEFIQELTKYLNEQEINVNYKKIKVRQ